MKIILASKSKVRKEILSKNNINCEVVHSNVDEDQAKDSLIEAGADPVLISKNLAELKSIKVSKKFNECLVLGADSVVSLDNKLINKPNSRGEALEILKKLNGSKHYLISSICISKNGSMLWNHTDTSELKMKRHTNDDLLIYLKKIETKTLLNYGVYQIEAGGLELFDSVKGDKDSIMGLPVKQLKQYLSSLK
jgi:septum formation protein